MSRHSTRLLRAALAALHYSGADNLFAPLTRGVGAIFMLHHVCPGEPRPFEPNRILKVTPQFLEEVIDQAEASGFEILSLDQAHDRLVAGDDRPFVCFTFDDGYRDNLEYAYPIFKRRNLPFAIYVASDFADGRGELWWLALEQAILKADVVEATIEGVLRRLPCATTAEKDTAFREIYWWLRRTDEDEGREFVRKLCGHVGFDPATLCSALAMTWDEIRLLARDPLVTIGGHTRRHYALAKLTPAQARAEIAGSVARIEREIGMPCRHFCYPYGDEISAGEREFEIAREIGLKTAVTTRKGHIHRHHASMLTALPRVSLNGDYQRARYVKVLLSGAPFALLNLVNRPAA